MARDGTNRGRKSKLTDDKRDFILYLASTGKTDEEIAQIVNIGTTTLYEWKKRDADFREALREAKDTADDKVEMSLYHLATGQAWVPESKFATHNGVITDEKETRRYVPHNQAAQVMWLKNRRPDKWRDKVELEHSGEVDTGCRGDTFAKLMKDPKTAKKAAELAEALAEGDEDGEV